MRENTDQNNAEYKHFSRSEKVSDYFDHDCIAQIIMWNSVCIVTFIVDLYVANTTPSTKKS